MNMHHYRRKAASASCALQSHLHTVLIDVCVFYGATLSYPLFAKQGASLYHSDTTFNPINYNNDQPARGRGLLLQHRMQAIF